MSEKRLIVTNTVANGVAQFASMFIGLVLMPWLIRDFGISGYGLYMLAGAVAAYSSLMDFGVGSALIKKIAERLAQDDREGIRRLASTALAFYVVIGLTVSVIALIVGMNAGHIFKVDADGARLLRNMMYVVAATSLLTWPLNTFGSVLAGFQKYTLTARTSLATAAGTAVVTLVVVLTGQGPFALMLGNSAVGLLGGVANFIMARRAIGAEKEVSPFDAERSVFREIVSFSWAIFVIQVCVLIVYQQTDRVILGIFVGSVAIALYEAAGKFQGFIQQLAAFSTSAVMPMASTLDSAGREPALQTLFLRGTKYAVALIAPVVVVLIVLAKPLLYRWLGPQFAAESLAAQILISHQLLTVNTAVGDSIIVGLGKLPKRLPNVIAFTAGNLILSLLLVRQFGILGVVIGTTIPFFFDYPFHIHLLVKEIGVSYSQLWQSVIRPTYPALLITLGVALLALQTPLMGSLLGIALSGAVAATAYWITLFFTALSPVERAEIKSLVAQFRNRLPGSN